MIKDQTASSGAIQRIVVVWMAIVACGVGMAGAQADISGTADSVSLKLPDQEELIVESVPEPEGSLVSFDGDALIAQTERLIERGRRVAALLEEAGIDDNFFRESWRERAAGAFVDLDSVCRTIDLAEPPARYAGQFDMVLDAVREFDAAIDILQTAIETDQQLYGGARKRFGGGELLASRGLDGLRRERLAERTEQPTSDPDPFIARRLIGTLCAAQAGQAEGLRYDRCVEAQSAAVETITNRHNFTESLDEPVFNTIRNRCLEEWPSDFVARDRCERQGCDSAHLP
jgi:hypothetical protein